MLLESKFGSFSEGLIAQIEAVGDVEELNRPYRQALAAQTLDEVRLQVAQIEKPVIKSENVTLVSVS